jgi:hypothetical protein
VTEPLDDTTEPRAAASGRAATGGDPTAAVSRDPITDEGSTVIARRESRRRQGRAAAAVTAPSTDQDAAAMPVAPASARSARPPHPNPAGSPLRGPEPVVVARATPRRGIPQPIVDAAAQDAARRGRSRTRMALVLGVGAVLVIAAATALVALLTMR